MSKINKFKIITKRTITMIFIIPMLIVLLSIFITDFQAAEARVTQAHINRLREDRQNIQKKMQNVQSQIDALEFDMLTETAKKNVLEDRIILTGFEIENIVATIEEYIILINDKELHIIELLENEEYQMQLYKERVRSMEESGIITYLEIIFDSTGFADLLARIEFITDIMRADERIYNNIVATRNETMAVRDELEFNKTAMELEFALLETKENDLLMQENELDNIIAKLDEDIVTAGLLHRQLSAEDTRIQQTINSRVEELRRQQERDRQRATREAVAINTWGSGTTGTTTTTIATSNEATPASPQSGTPAHVDSGDENLKWLAFIIQIEARNECLQGKMAVGNVVMNRVRSPLFPSTIKDVILAPGQFPPAHSRDVNTFPVSASSLEAARRVLNGEKANGIGNALYFNRAGANSWAAQNRPLIITIGYHDFFG